MEPQNGGLEDDFPFQLSDFEVPAVNFQGLRTSKDSKSQRPFSMKNKFTIEGHKYIVEGHPKKQNKKKQQLDTKLLDD